MKLMNIINELQARDDHYGLRLNKRFESIDSYDVVCEYGGTEVRVVGKYRVSPTIKAQIKEKYDYLSALPKNFVTSGMYVVVLHKFSINPDGISFNGNRKELLDRCRSLYLADEPDPSNPKYKPSTGLVLVVIIIDKELVTTMLVKSDDEGDLSKRFFGSGIQKPKIIRNPIAHFSQL